MDSEQVKELEEEVRSLRLQVARLSETVADRRARALHLEAVVANLRRQLRAGANESHVTSPEERAW